MGIWDELGPALRRLRVERGLTRKRLGKAAGLTVAQIEEYEAGRRLPTLPSLERHLDALGAGLGELSDQLCRARGGAGKHDGTTPTRQEREAPPEEPVEETEEDVLKRLERVAMRILRAALDRRVTEEDAETVEAGRRRAR